VHTVHPGSQGTAGRINCYEEKPMKLRKPEDEPAAARERRPRVSA
jgi:hypothetical protein